MTRTAAPHGKHIPLRTCVGCRATKPKRTLARIVRTAEGHIAIDTTGKARGRGAYLCPKSACARRALKAGTLNRALRSNVDDAALAELRAWAEQLSAPANLPADPPKANLAFPVHRDGAHPRERRDKSEITI